LVVAVLERRGLTEVTGGDGGPEAAGDLGYAGYEHGYDSPLSSSSSPLDAGGSRGRGSTLRFRGPADVGSAQLRARGRLNGQDVTGLPQRVGPGAVPGPVAPAQRGDAHRRTPRDAGGTGARPWPPSVRRGRPPPSRRSLPVRRRRRVHDQCGVVGGEHVGQLEAEPVEQQSGVVPAVPAAGQAIPGRVLPGGRGVGRVGHHNVEPPSAHRREEVPASDADRDAEKAGNRAGVCGGPTGGHGGHRRQARSSGGDR
jgi:hypothetical protein